MRYPLRAVLFIVMAALLAISCSSSTVVERAERGTSDQDSDQSPDNPDNSDPDNSNPDNSNPDESTADDSDQSDQDDSAQASSSDNDNDGDGDTDRGGRDVEGGAQTPRELEEQAGFGLGGAEQIAGLLADCQTDNDLACDVLFQLSDVDSTEETAAQTCGGRDESEPQFCTDGIDNTTQDPFFDEDSPGLDAVVEACDDGDMTACDFLYFRSPIDSTFQEIGETCGGRTQLALPDCRTFFAEG